MVPCKSTAEEVSFERSHNRNILSTDLKLHGTLHVFLIHAEGERVKGEMNQKLTFFFLSVE